MDEFFQSIAQAFARNRSASENAGIGLLALLGLVLALTLGGWLRRRFAARARFRVLARQRGLSEEDLRFAARLARHVAIQPVSLLVHLDQFERATARGLAGSGGGEAAERILRIRRALGFDRLPPHTPLLSTRELRPGTAIDVGTQRCLVSEVDETSFSVDALCPAGAEPGEHAPLGLVKTGEARYALRCRLLGAQREGAGILRLVYSHDEAPTRLQAREYARVAAKGPIALRPVESPAGHTDLGPELEGELVDVSGGGALVAGRDPIPVGLLATASFALGERLFAGLRAVVLSCSRTPDGRWRTHLEFGGLSEPERERLVAAVAHLEAESRER